MQCLHNSGAGRTGEACIGCNSLIPDGYKIESVCEDNIEQGSIFKGSS